MTATSQQASQLKTDYDAIVIGLGFGGIYALHKLRNELGLSVRAFDKAGGVGGTWYWNRYPGAMSDTESFVYRYSFDKEFLNEWDWDTRYLNQPDILRYLEATVDRYQLRDDIQLNSGIASAVFDEDTNRWTLTTEDGQAFTAQYVVSGLGLLSKINIPDIKGIDTFKGALVHTGAWPEGLSIDGKRVGVIGTGSTGTQFICAASKIADHLTVFQRTPQYSVPSGNGPVTAEYVADVRSRYDEIWDQVRGSGVAFGFVESTTPAMSVSDEERQRVFQENWDIGNGFRFMFGTFSDLATDAEANEEAAVFIRSKIAEIVDDPETVRKLTPHDLYARRPLCNKDYYETYNRDNVSLVSIKENPIVEITPEGVKTADGVVHELDVLVFATGFDSVDGNYLRMDIRGKGGETIQKHWEKGATSYLGIATVGFPGLFMILGPGGPFTNLVPSIEVQVEWISQLVADANAAGAETVEVRAETEKAWADTCDMIAGYTLFPKVDSWIFGANIPGKTTSVVFYLAGLGAYREQLAAESAGGYQGFTLQGVKTAASV